MTIDVRVVAPAEFGAVSAAALLDLAAEFASPVVALATGQTPVAMYTALHDAVVQGRVTVDAIRPFALDEYAGDPTNPCSNRSYFAQHWQEIPGARAVAQFDAGAADLDADVRRLAAALDASGGIDIAVLGVGTNGHLAFNEPGSAIDAPARVVELTEASRVSARRCWGDATPTRGLTLGMRQIMASKRILLLANGAAKAPVVARALNDQPSDACPATWLQLHDRVVVVVDSDAYRR